MTCCRPGGIWAVLALAIATGARAQIPASIEFRVLKAPTVAAGDSGAFLTYELHLTNLTLDTVLLKRVEVVSAVDTTRSMLVVEDSALNRVISRPGSNVTPSNRLRIAGGSRALLYLWVPVERQRPPAALRQRLTFQRLAGDSATYTLSGAVTPVDPAPVRIRAPLRGEWLAANGPSNMSGHRRTVIALDGKVAIGQRFAIDFLQIDSTGRSWRPGSDSTKNTSYYAYGNEIYAVGNGIVVETKDSIPENSPRSAVARAVPINLVTVAGNHIVINLGHGHFAFYAHVQPGSLRVKLGDRVRRGQVIALLGNSGNSTEPHLHFHVSDGVSPLGSEGIPYALTSMDVVGRCTLSATGIACTRTAPVAVIEAMPLQNLLVRLP
jgi:hypothetical protein